MSKPFLKWAGGKHKLLATIAPHLPPGRRLIVPFLGGGGIALGTDYEQTITGDINPDLINLYAMLAKEGIEFVNFCARYFVAETNTKKQYYLYREEFNSISRELYPELRAALFLYLNRHGFNGLCRYNNKGGYNVPFGRYKRPYFPRQELEAFIQKTKDRMMIFEYMDFAALLGNHALAGDVVYCDPPYVPLSDTSSFTAYAGGTFTMDDQRLLVKWAQALQARGITVVVSNSDTPVTRELYAGADTLQAIQVQRNIAAKGKKRAKVGELIAVYKPRIG